MYTGCSEKIPGNLYHRVEHVNLHKKGLIKNFGTISVSMSTPVYTYNPIARVPTETEIVPKSKIVIIDQ